MTNDKELYDSELEKLLNDPRIIRLCQFPQHHGSNTLDHCVAVARRAFELAEKLEWKIDEKELARGAMLHDYYQYSIKEEGLTAYKHGTRHPQIAMEKADKDFNLTDKEKNIADICPSSQVQRGDPGQSCGQGRGGQGVRTA